MSRTKPFSCKRLRKKGIRSNLVHDTLVELVSTDDEDPLYKVSFKKKKGRYKPLIGKVFNAQVIKGLRVTEKFKKTAIKKGFEKMHSDMQYLDQQIRETQDEEVKQKYIEQRDELRKTFIRNARVLDTIKKHSYSGIKARTKTVKLRVIGIDYDKNIDAYHCLCEPFKK